MEDTKRPRDDEEEPLDEKRLATEAGYVAIRVQTREQNERWVQEHPTLTSLGKDVIGRFIMELDVRLFMTLAQVHRNFARIANTEVVWQNFLIRDMPNEWLATNEQLPTFVPRDGEGPAWKRWYLYLRNMYVVHVRSTFRISRFDTWLERNNLQPSQLSWHEYLSSIKDEKQREYEESEMQELKNQANTRPFKYCYEYYKKEFDIFVAVANKRFRVWVSQLMQSTTSGFPVELTDSKLIHRVTAASGRSKNQELAIDNAFTWLDTTLPGFRETYPHQVVVILYNFMVPVLQHLYQHKSILCVMGGVYRRNTYRFETHYDLYDTDFSCLIWLDPMVVPKMREISDSLKTVAEPFPEPIRKTFPYIESYFAVFRSMEDKLRTLPKSVHDKGVIVGSSVCGTCISGRLSPAKASHMLHEGKVLTDKQRRFFACRAHGGCGYGEDSAEMVIDLLNRRTRKDSHRALAMLSDMFLGDSGAVNLEFSHCDDKKESVVYPGFKTGYANGSRIHICIDSLGDAFNAQHSKTIAYDSARVTHYAAMFLHEFGHVLDKRDIEYDDWYGGNTQVERRADAFAQWFINKL